MLPPLLGPIPTPAQLGGMLQLTIHNAADDSMHISFTTIHYRNLQFAVGELTSSREKKWSD